MRFDILTLFPGFFAGPVRESIIGRAIENGIIEVNAWNIRDWAPGRHRVTDDAPYGGGAGMVLKAEPVALALEAVRAMSPDAPTVILSTPQGMPFTQTEAQKLSGCRRIAIICGRYEGVDERIRPLADAEYSIGDYVLTGGELPALVMMDAVARLVPGVLGDAASAEDESFSNGLIEYPQYTRPEDWMGQRVPGVLLSGNHAQIAAWRRRESVIRTAKRRPGLLEAAGLTEEERRLAESVKAGRTDKDE
ncbi:MAG: tRNA (guanosine(37)-N1)-methyltransferase TrmD [Deltaproteobacteria bacterium]|nr:tRNA (guanosine(37)-N1)-methyltransferase TrmD [Deltaproteobacteria bacterium]